MANLKSIAGLLYSNDKILSVVGETAENGGIESGSNANGNYVKFPDGTLIQWGNAALLYVAGATNVFGSTSGATNDSTATVTLPVAFASTAYTVSAVPLQGGVNGVRIPSKTTISFDMWSYYITGKVPNYEWAAIGRWK